MPRISDALLRTRIPTALIIGAEPELLDRCQAAAVEVGVVAKGCPESMAAALTEERRPLALVLPEAVYAVDAARYDAMARAVTGTVVRVTPDVSEHDLAELLYRAVRASMRQREARAGSGRHPIVEDATPPPSVRSPSSDRTIRTYAPPVPVRRETPPPSSRRVASPLVDDIDEQAMRDRARRMK